MPELQIATHPEETELATYRPLSLRAVGSLVCGVLSVLAIAHLGFAFLPLLAVALAVFALGGHGLRSGSETGRSLALAGLVLGLALGSFSISQHVARRLTLFAAAKTCADQWLRTVNEGRLQEAHHLTLPTSQRIKPGQTLAKFYGDASKLKSPSSADGMSPEMIEQMTRQMMESGPAMQFDSWSKEADVRWLSQSPGQMDFQWLKNQRLELRGLTTYVELHYRVTQRGGATPESRIFSLQLVRDWEDGHGQWRVERMTQPQ